MEFRCVCVCSGGVCGLAVCVCVDWMGVWTGGVCVCGLQVCVCVYCMCVFVCGVLLCAYGVWCNVLCKYAVTCVLYNWIPDPACVYKSNPYIWILQVLWIVTL